MTKGFQRTNTFENQTVEVTFFLHIEAKKYANQNRLWHTIRMLKVCFVWGKWSSLLRSKGAKNLKVENIGVLGLIIVFLRFLPPPQAKTSRIERCVAAATVFIPKPKASDMYELVMKFLMQVMVKMKCFSICACHPSQVCNWHQIACCDITECYSQLFVLLLWVMQLRLLTQPVGICLHCLEWPS